MLQNKREKKRSNFYDILLTFSLAVLKTSLARTATELLSSVQHTLPAESHTKRVPLTFFPCPCRWKRLVNCPTKSLRSFSQLLPAPAAKQITSHCPAERWQSSKPSDAAAAGDCEATNTVVRRCRSEASLAMDNRTQEASLCSAWLVCAVPSAAWPRELAPIMEWLRNEAFKESLPHPTHFPHPSSSVCQTGLGGKEVAEWEVRRLCG